MNVIVLGAGVVGTTTAYYLAKAGHQVTVIERESNVALETSFGNAGQISPGYAAPWAAPGIPLKAVKWLLQQHSPLRLKPTSDSFQYQWLLKLFRECNSTRYTINKERMVRLSEYSRDCFDELRQETGIYYEGRQLSTLQLFRTQELLDAVGKDIKVLKEEGVPFELLDKQGVIACEPGLAQAKVDFVGGLRMPHDETGDCFVFTNKLAEMAKALGVQFMFNSEIAGIHTQGDRISHVSLSNGQSLTADNYVVALSAYSRQLLQPLGISIPVYPLKGYSITTQITQPDLAPVSTILDESYKIALTRFDNRIRVGGMAEVCGFNLDLKENRRDTLKMVLTDLFPNASDLSELNFWTGLRPATPDGTPIIGATHIGNLFLNTGHGTLGWTMSCGSGKLLSDMMSGKPTQISTEGLDISRYK